jgi:hypothetical protein
MLLDPTVELAVATVTLHAVQRWSLLPRRAGQLVVKWREECILSVVL